ncbi:hypothetical protein ACOMHN_022584 [Nucella lapillus]
MDGDGGWPPVIPERYRLAAAPAPRYRSLGSILLHTSLVHFSVRACRYIQDKASKRLTEKVGFFAGVFGDTRQGETGRAPTRECNDRQETTGRCNERQETAGRGNDRRQDKVMTGKRRQDDAMTDDRTMQ